MLLPPALILFIGGWVYPSIPLGIHTPTPPPHPPPTPSTTGYVQQAGGTHPTGMHSCIKYCERQNLTTLPYALLLACYPINVFVLRISGSGRINLNNVDELYTSFRNSFVKFNQKCHLS